MTALDKPLGTFIGGAGYAATDVFVLQIAGRRPVIASPAGIGYWLEESLASGELSLTEIERIERWQWVDSIRDWVRAEVDHDTARRGTW